MIAVYRQDEQELPPRLSCCGTRLYYSHSDGCPAQKQPLDPPGSFQTSTRAPGEAAWRAGGPSPYWQDEQVTLLLGDALEVLQGLPDSSVAAP